MLTSSPEGIAMGEAKGSVEGVNQGGSLAGRPRPALLGVAGRGLQRTERGLYTY